jgi:uncharacterized protein YegL
MNNLPNPFPGINVSVNTGVTVTPTQQTTTYEFKDAGTNGTLIVVVLDESGSMGTCWDATIAGFNEFIQGQRTAEDAAGQASLTLTKFNGWTVSTVYQNLPLNEVPLLNKQNYTPNGGTNLLDAIGNSINDVNTILSGLKKKDRPGVIITIMTDGEENSSRKYNNQHIKDMVKSAENSDWTFQFLGANIDAFSVGSTFGMSASNSVNYSTQNMGATMASVSASTVRTRTAKMAGIGTHAIYSTGLYTAQELKSMKE